MAKISKSNAQFESGRSTFADLKAENPITGERSLVKGAEIVDAIQPEYTADGYGDWCYQGHMIQGLGASDYPALSLSDLRYPEWNIPGGKGYFDPLQGLPPRGIIREVTDPSDDYNRIGGEGQQTDFSKGKK